MASERGLEASWPVASLARFGRRTTPRLGRTTRRREGDLSAKAEAMTTTTTTTAGSADSPRL